MAGFIFSMTYGNKENLIFKQVFTCETCLLRPGELAKLRLPDGQGMRQFGGKI